MSQSGVTGFSSGRSTVEVFVLIEAMLVVTVVVVAENGKQVVTCRSPATVLFLGTECLVVESAEEAVLVARRGRMSADSGAILALDRERLSMGLGVAPGLNEAQSLGRGEVLVFNGGTASEVLRAVLLLGREASSACLPVLLVFGGR